MSIDKTAQLNWLRRLRDRNRSNNESGQELSFNEQELRGLQDMERRNADEERQRVDRLVEESKKRTETVGRFDYVPGKFKLSRDSITNVLTMEPNALWSALCASFENCSPYVSKDTEARGRVIRYIVENRHPSAAGWGRTLMGIAFLLEGLELDVKNMADSNRLEESSYEWAKSRFINERWLYENERLLQNAITNASPDNEALLFKNLIEDLSEQGQIDALIKLWAIWHRGTYGQFESRNYIPYRDMQWVGFKSYIKQKQAEIINKIGVALSKKYLPAEMQITNDGVHNVETNIFNVMHNVALRDRYSVLSKWDIEKWKSFIRDMYLMIHVAGIELKGKSNLNNINAKNLFFNMTQKIAMIENIIIKDTFLSQIIKNDFNSYTIPHSLYKKVLEDMNSHMFGYMGASVSVLQQMEASRYGGYRKQTADATDASLQMTASGYLPEEMETVLLHLSEGGNFYSIRNNWEQYQSLSKRIRELQYAEWQNVRDRIKNPDLQALSPEEAMRYTQGKINDVKGRDFGSDNAQKAKEERILDSPFEHASRIVPSSFPGSRAFSTHYLPGIKSPAVPFNIAVYPRRKENDPESFAQVFEPPSQSPGLGGFNFHHHNISTLNDENHYNHIIGWIGGFADMVGKNMYILELQSDVMQHTNYMKNPEKSKNKLNEDLKKHNQELQKEKENLAKQSAEGIDAYYEKRIKDLEKKRDAANNDNMKQQMDTAIQKLTEQKNAKEDPWGKLRKKIQDIENVIAEIVNQLKELAEYESNTRDSWRKRPQFADVKSKIENRFSEYIDVFWNEVIYYCAKLEIKNLWISHSEYLAKAWRTWATADTIDMYKKIYDKRAQEFGAEKQGDWWHLDLTNKMPKYASTNWYQRTKNGMV